jgi:hypothetical protein
MAREPPHSRWRWSHSQGDTAGVQRMAREPCHVETAGEKRGILVFTSDRFLCSQATGLVVERRSIGRVFKDRVKVVLVGAVSEVLVRA